MTTDDFFEDTDLYGVLPNFEDYGAVDMSGVEACYDACFNYVPKWMDLGARVAALWRLWRTANPGQYKQHNEEFLGEKALAALAALCSDNAAELVALTESEDKTCPLPLVGRALENLEIAELLAEMPVFDGAIDALVLQLADQQVPTLGDGLLANWTAYEEAFLKIVDSAITDLPKLIHLETVVVDCDSCSESADCIFNEANANNVSVLACLAREVAINDGKNANHWVVEFEAIDGSARLVEWVQSRCGGDLERVVLESFMSPGDMHTWLIGKLVT